MQLDEGPGDRVIEALDGHVIDIALGADGVSTTVVLDDGRLLSINNVDGTGTTVATIPGATNMAVDDKVRTAAIDSDGRITILDRHHNPDHERGDPRRNRAWRSARSALSSSPSTPRTRSSSASRRSRATPSGSAACRSGPRARRSPRRPRCR